MKLKKKVILTLTALMVAYCLVGNAFADDKPTASLTTDFYSQYIWRGFAFSRDSLVIQPSMTVSYKGFSANLWGNLDTRQYETLNNGDRSSDFNETDLTLSYDGSAGKFGYGAGYIYYGLVGKDSQEVYATASYDTLLSPNLTVYKEITGLQGWYAKLGVSHAFKVVKDISLNLGASASYYDDQNGYHAMHDGVLSASLDIPVTQYISVSPELYYSFPLSSKAKDYLQAANSDLIDKAKADFVYGGLGVNLAF